MPFTAVVRKDFADSVRSFVLASTTLLFVAFAGFQAAIKWIPRPYRDSPIDPATLALLNSMRQPAVLLIPLIGLLVAYDTVAGERESGSLRLLLGLPNARGEVLLGKFVGRTAVVAVGVLAGYAVVAAIALATYESFAVGVFVGYAVLTVVYGGVYVAIATGASCAMSSRLDALSVAGGLYALFIIGWDLGLYLVQAIFYGGEPPAGGFPDWFNFLGMLNPSTAFMKASRAAIPAYRDLTFYPSQGSAYVQDWVGIPILVAWIVVPLALGYWRFARADVE